MTEASFEPIVIYFVSVINTKVTKALNSQKNEKMSSSNELRGCINH